MTTLQYFVNFARGKVDHTQLTRRTVLARLTEANGFKVIMDGGNTLIVSPRADPKNIIEPGNAEWVFQWDGQTGELSIAPDLFFVWWNNPKDLKNLVENGHYAAHEQELRNIQWEKDRAFDRNLADKMMRPQLPSRNR
jgi:hypothetical protein